MFKTVRKAIRCYLIKDNKAVVTKYKKGNKKEVYYDIPGGKIEEGELPEQTAIMEMKEETGDYYYHSLTLCVSQLPK